MWLPQNISVSIENCSFISSKVQECSTVLLKYTFFSSKDKVYKDMRLKFKEISKSNPSLKFRENFISYL